MNYVGIDHHRQYSHLKVMDQEGQTIRAGWVRNVRVEIEKFLEGLEAAKDKNLHLAAARQSGQRTPANPEHGLPQSR